MEYASSEVPRGDVLVDKLTELMGVPNASYYYNTDDLISWIHCSEWFCSLEILTGDKFPYFVTLGWSMGGAVKSYSWYEGYPLREAIAGALYIILMRLKENNYVR